MRRLTRLLGVAAAVLTTLGPLAAMAQPSAYGVRWSCGYEEGKVFIERLERASEEDLSCLAGAGFLRETLAKISPGMDEERHRLRRLLQLLLDADEEALAFFEKDAAAGEPEAVLWLLVARGEAGLAVSTTETRRDAVNTFVVLPQWARQQFASPLADALLAEGDARAALTLATVLQAVAEDPDEKAKAAMIRARVIERHGTVDEAVALYEEAIELGSDRLQAEAELRKIALMWRTGYIKTEEAVIALRELVTIWRGEDLGAGISLALARAYYFDGQLPQSLRLLAAVAGSNAPAEITDEAERRIRSIAEDLFVRRTVPSTIGDLMDVYELVRPFIGPKDTFWMGDLTLAETLRDAHLMAGAEKLVAGAEPEALKAGGGHEALLRAAGLMVDLGDREAARAHLAAIARQDLEGEERAEFARLEARAAEIGDLGALLAGDASQDVVRIVAERAWRAGAYGLYTEARALAVDGRTWKEPLAEYLARGTRIEGADPMAQDDPRLKALSSAPKPSVYHAEDLRPLLDPSAEVAGLAATLTRIGQEPPQAPSSEAPAKDGGQAKNGTSL